MYVQNVLKIMHFWIKINVIVVGNIFMTVLLVLVNNNVPAVLLNFTSLKMIDV